MTRSWRKALASMAVVSVITLGQTVAPATAAAPGTTASSLHHVSARVPTAHSPGARPPAAARRHPNPGNPFSAAAVAGHGSAAPAQPEAEAPTSPVSSVPATPGSTPVALPPGAASVVPMSRADVAPKIPTTVAPLSVPQNAYALDQGLGATINLSGGAWTASHTAGTVSVRDSVTVSTTGATPFDVALTFYAPIGQTLSVGTSTHVWPVGTATYSQPAVSSYCADGQFTIEDLSTSGSTVSSFAVTLQCPRAWVDGVPAAWSNLEVRFQSTVVWVGLLFSTTNWLKFPSRLVGDTSDPQSLVITSVGSGPLAVTSVTATGTPAAFPVQSDTCTGATVAPGMSCSIAFEFSPATAGAFWAHLTVEAQTGVGLYEPLDLIGNSLVVVSVTKSGTGSGTVSATEPSAPSTAVISCGAVCSAQLDWGTEVTFQATPNTGSLTGSWGGACSGTATVACGLTLAGTSVAVGAGFTRGAIVTVARSGAGHGTVTSEPVGIDCGATCSATFPLGTHVTLTGTPDLGSVLVTWSGACSGATCTFTAGTDLAATARFELGNALTRATLLSGAPGLQASAGYPGVTSAATGLEPPDPWIAVGPSHVVQASNDGIRVSDRSGHLIADYYLWDFFGEPAGTRYDGDPRVVWDPWAGRWLATEFSADCSTGRVNLAVSRTSDPTGVWDLWFDSFSGLLPDYPGLGYSSERVAFSYNLFALDASCGVSTYVGAGLLVADSASLLALKPATWASPTNPAVFAIRPAMNITNQPGVYAVAEGPSGEVEYQRIWGAIVAPYFDQTDLSAAHNETPLPPFVMPPAPVQPGSPATVAAAVDERPTDAIFTADGLWFVSTTGCYPAGDPVLRACVRVTGLAGPQDFTVSAPGLSTFMGGIGASGDGTVHIVYSQSGPSQPISTYATYHRRSDPASAIHQPALLRAGEATYTGTRWGDYVGVSPDPTDPSAVWEANQYPDATGGWSTWVARLRPNGTGAPAGSLAINAGATSTSSTDVALTLTPAAGAGVAQALVSNTATLSGGRLSKAKSLPAGGLIGWSLADAATGGSGTHGVHTVYVQWGNGAGTWSSVTTATITYGPPSNVLRLAGSGRMQTAAAISAATFKPGVEVAYVAYAYNFPDALAGAAAAGTVKGPVLLSSTKSLDAATSAELTRLRPRMIAVLGGTGVISDAVLKSLAPYAISGVVIRLAGNDRFATAARISQFAFAPHPQVAYVAYAYNFPDALAGAAAAGTVKGPVLLAATSGTLNASTKNELLRLAPARIIVLGGTGVISNSVLSQLTSLPFSHTTTRVAGASRFATAAAIAKATFGAGTPTAYIAYAYNFPDALAGAAAAGTLRGPVLLSATNLPLDASTSSTLTSLKPASARVLGGTGVLSDAVLGALGAYVP